MKTRVTWKDDQVTSRKDMYRNAMRLSSPAGLMTESVVPRLQLGRDSLPVDVSQVAVLDDGEQEILVSLVVPHGGHSGWWSVWNA